MVPCDYWIIEWQDRDPFRGFKCAERTAEEAVQTIRDFLSGETAIDEDVELDPDSEDLGQAERPAFDLLFQDEDAALALRGLREEITQETSDGRIIITPCWERR